MTTDFNSINGRSSTKSVAASTRDLIAKYRTMRGAQIRREHEAWKREQRRAKGKDRHVPYSGGVPEAWECTVTEYQPLRPEVA